LALIKLFLNNTITTPKIQTTPNKIKIKKKDTLLCKSTIPVNPGEAGSWKPICQG
jgi:hypothetical protein